MQIAMTSLKSGGGIWKIQYSDDGKKYEDCAVLEKSNYQHEVAWPCIIGSH